MQTKAHTKESTVLKPSDTEQVKEELGLVDPMTIEVPEEVDPALEKMADEFVKAILSFNPEEASQAELRQQNIATVENIGAKTQKDAALRSAMLKEPIRKLAAKGEDGGEVANALLDLNIQVEALDPGKFDFEAGWFPRLLGFIPGVGKPMKRYFLRYESAQTVLDAIFRSLEGGADMLKRDNLTLSEDQKKMRELTAKLQKAIELGMLLDRKLNTVLEQEVPSDDPRFRFIQEELLFPLRQRVIDLQQQLAVNQQAILAIEIVIRNNKELVRGVNRAVNVTSNALNVAVTVALALANQKIVLDRIEATNATTNKLIGDTARKLREQGVEIHKQAATSQLDINTLKQAFNDISQALNDISKFRKEALPQMAGTILELDSLTKSTEESITRLEKGDKVSPSMYLEID
ncbi:MAG: toxic anion resistance protein [Proteobacteria bacterium]|nr:toxic anion resistance protein [Pseudomonadota bacterium]MBU1640346.1 toxic anion resistance protein [Pseudomonadota bacterium]